MDEICLSDARQSAGRFFQKMTKPVFAFILLITSLAASPLAAEPVDLTDEERAYIAAYRVATIGLVADNEPYSFYLNGKIMGWSVDVLDAISAMTGLDFAVRLGSWPEIYGQFRQGGLDVIADISFTEERDPFILFTEPYHLRRTILFENVDRPLGDLADTEALKARRIGVIRDIYYANALKDAGFQLQEYATYRDLMAAVAFGWVDGALAAELTGNFFIRENGFTNVAAAGALPLTAVSLEDFRLGVLDQAGDAALLSSILQKAVLALPPETLDEITDRWLSYRTGRTSNGGLLRLLPEEQAFIEEAPTLSIGFIIDYQPFSYLENGRGQGLAVDLAQYISASTGLSFEPVYDNWAKLLQRFKSGDLDIITNISHTEERSEFTLFSDEYHRIPNAVFVRSGFGPYRDIADLDGKRIGIGRDIYYADAVSARFDDVRQFDGQEALIHALADGEIDAAIASLSNGNSIIRRDGLINIQIGGEFLMDGVEREDLRFGVSPKYPYLESIIDRSLASIPLARWQEMENRWLGPPLAGIDRRRAVLDEDERDYLHDRGPLRVCVDPRSPPYTMIERDGDFTGAIADILALLGENGEFSWQIQPVPLTSDSEREAALAGCDVLPFVANADFAGSDYDLTPSYLEMALAVASRLQAPFVESMRDLEGQRVGVVSRHAPLTMLKARYPDVAIVALDGEGAGLDAVLGGELDAVVGPLDTLVYLIAARNTNDIKISGRISENVQVVAATTAAEPMLGDIFEKLIATLDPVEVDRILNRQKLAPFKRAIDYRLLFATAALIAVVFLVFLYWVRKLRLLNRALNTANDLLQQSSITDGLTGLYNRTHFIARAEVAFEQCRRDGERFTLTMLDVDHFKPINDRMGHVFGDACLEHLAAVFRSHFQRADDMVARYGGEEFIAYHIAGGPEEIRAFLEDLRAKVEASPVRHHDYVQPLTVSIGFYSAVPGEHDTLDRFIAEADQRLYDAKEAGRNRVIGND
ncbi:diguanylate cyclase [Martelella mediterranea]|uniref:Stalked cell differentiation-controlling protein n=1 Tax=Martelella mediterranea DSM 17316 TaxID=1122214 RepID=A0A1U9YXT4_9HYPH|nr:transporter substrate-binding domain-containing protein [Martelella mediterranea]AQZ50257.1 Stalked cell differentiation-controlling protein [Martelella mediterranea DSM 17316]